MPLFCFFHFLSHKIENPPDWVMVLLRTLTLLVSVPYVISRLILLVLPFCALRSLTAEIYQAVPWVMYTACMIFTSLPSDVPARLRPGLEGLTALVRVRLSLSCQGGLGLGSAYGWATAFEKVLMEFTYYAM
jgi:hypothetical protein